MSHMSLLSLSILTYNFIDMEEQNTIVRKNYN